MYNSAEVYGEDFFVGLAKTFGTKSAITTTAEAAFFLHQVAFVLNHAGDQMQKDAGLFQGVDLTQYTSCLKNIQASSVTPDMLTYIDASFQAYSISEFKSVGLYLGTVAQICNKLPSIISQWCQYEPDD